MYSYSLDVILLLLYFAISCPLDSCASWTLSRTEHTHLGLWPLSIPDPPELRRSSGHLTLDPLNSSQTSFHPCLALMPVTGPANMQQTGSQPACRTHHLAPPLTARSDSGRSYVRATVSNFRLLTSRDSHARSFSYRNHPYLRSHLYFYPLTIFTPRRTRTRRQEPIIDIPELPTGDNDKTLVLQYDARNI